MRKFGAWWSVLVAGMLLASAAPAAGEVGPLRQGEHVRFGTFNASLNRAAEGELLADLSTPDDPQARAVAEVVQRNRPEVLLVNEFDYVPANAAADAFRANYLRLSQHGAQPVDYPYAYTAPVNTGIPTGFDLDRDGQVGGPGNSQGFGDFAGQYGMLVLSRYAIDTTQLRTFQHFLWKDMPNALLPDDPTTPARQDWYSPKMLRVLRLSSKSHWDLPIRVGQDTVHFLVSHPTPPSFDGPEDRNGMRNNDEIRFWADYVTPGRGDYIYDERNLRGALAPGERFVVAGDVNSDPHDGESVSGAIDQLRTAPSVRDPHAAGLGGFVAARQQGGANRNHRGNPVFDTADFADQSPGNLRTDYILPSWGLVPWRAEVFWPVPGRDLARLNDASDHHLVRADVRVPTAIA